MGFDTLGVKFLVAAKSAGVSFTETVTLGRQGFFPKPKPLQNLFRILKVEQNAPEFISNSGGFAESFLTLLGAHEIIAIDNSDYEGASVVHDMNQPIGTSLKNKFSAVIDGGTLEHVFNFPRALQNCMEMLRVGGHYIAIAPANNFCGHGFYQFSPELFFRVFSRENGFYVCLALTHQTGSWYRITDPAKFGGRVELSSNRPSFLFIAAEKKFEVPTFRVFPQQSDYTATWQHHSHARPLAPSSRDKRKCLIQMLPPGVKEFLRPYRALLPLNARAKCYQKLDEKELLLGHVWN
jgi:hypothetical protein